MFSNSVMSRMNIAMEMALNSSMEYKIGTIVVKSGRVLGKGWNQYGSNAFTQKWFKHPTIHAEIDALFRSPWNLMDGSILYSYRYRPCGTPGLAKPCNRCQIALKALGVRTVFYTIPEYPFVEKMTF